MEAAMKKEYDRGLMYAEACFETFRVIDGALFRWSQHERRLRGGLADFGLVLPERLEARCLEAARTCASDALVRLTVTGGSAPWGLMPPERRDPGVYVQATPYAPPREALHMRSVTWPWPLLPRPAKFTADYAATLRGLRLLDDALPAGESALVCDTAHVCAATTANVLIHRQGVWWTPAHVGALPGVVRTALLEASAVREVDCPRAWLADCEAMALVSSGVFIRPVASVDGRALVRDAALFDPLWQALVGEPGVPAGVGGC